MAPVKHRSRRGPAGITLLVVVLSSVARMGAAQQEPPRRVVLTHEDPEFRKGLELLLSSAGAEVVLAPTPDTPATLDLLERSRELAAREEAVVVVWLVPQGADTKLVMVNRDGDRVLSKVLGYTPPLSEEQAAEAVLAARTMFDALDVLSEAPPPVSGDAGAGTVPEAPPAETSAPSPPRPDSTEGAPSTAEPPTVATSVPSTGGHVLVEAGAAMRVSAVTTPSFGVGAAWRHGRLAFGLWGGAAVGKDLSGPRFAGSWNEVDLAALVRVDALRFARARLEVGGGVGAHRVRLQGRLPGDGNQPVDETKWDPALRLDVGGYLRVTGRIELGLTLAGNLFLWRQEFLVGPEEVLGMPTVAGVAGLQIRVLIL